MISTLELRHIIETAFLPTKCICSVRAGSLMIQLVDPTTQQELLTVAGVDPKALGSSRAIARLVAEIKEELILRGDAGIAALDQFNSSLTRHAKFFPPSISSVAHG